MSQTQLFLMGCQFGEVGIYFHFADLLVNLLDLSDGAFKAELQQQVDRLSQRRNPIKLQMIELIHALTELGLREPEPPTNPPAFYEFTRTQTDALLEHLEDGSEEWLGFVGGLRYGNLLVHFQVMSLLYRLLMIEVNHGVVRTQLSQLLDHSQTLCDKFGEVLEHPEFAQALADNLRDGLDVVRGLELAVPETPDQAQLAGIEIQSGLNQFMAAKTCGVVMMDRAAAEASS